MANDYADMKKAPMEDLKKNPEEYPYGLRLNLCDDDLKRLDLEGIDVGDTIHIMAFATVCSTNESIDDGSKNCYACLQITHMKAYIEDEEDYEESDDRTPAEKIYGKK